MPELCSWKRATPRSPDPTNQVPGADYPEVKDAENPAYPAAQYHPSKDTENHLSAWVRWGVRRFLSYTHGHSPQEKLLAWEGTSQRHREGSEKSQPHRRTAKMPNSAAAARTVPRGRSSMSGRTADHLGQLSGTRVVSNRSILLFFEEL